MLTAASHVKIVDLLASIPVRRKTADTFIYELYSRERYTVSVRMTWQKLLSFDTVAYAEFEPEAS